MSDNDCENSSMFLWTAPSYFKGCCSFLLTVGLSLGALLCCVSSTGVQYRVLGLQVVFVLELFMMSVVFVLSRRALDHRQL